MRVVVAMGGNALLKRGEAMTADVQRRNVRIAAEAAGVSVRTAWRWLAQARQGHAEPVYRRGGFTLDDALWARLEALGGNVAELHRELEQASDEAPLQGRLPSLGTMHRAVREQLRAGRILQTTSRRRGHAAPDRYDRALAELALRLSVLADALPEMTECALGVAAGPYAAVVTSAEVWIGPSTARPDTGPRRLRGM